MAGGAAVGPLFQAIVIGGLVAGSVDIFAAAIINHVGPGVILQAIASGLLGKASFQGGETTMAVGLLLQWGMSLIIAAIYGLAAARIPALPRRPVRFGALYGVGVFLVMTFVVVPLSAAHFKARPSITSLLENLGAMILFGLIVALTPWLMAKRRVSA
ncbi:MAG: hypothetical protein H0X27_03400 [Caulobacteraceae bacterium]|nr:hypothetical protein [Caulobacteraceae bacterium]